ncbi:MAG: glycosyltransferase [Proteobacteria bacterium]|nr:MAG: glycosyltransferase [Pseudomonadota bacterium]
MSSAQRRRLVVSIVLYNNAIDQVASAIRSCLTDVGGRLETIVVLVDNSPTDALRELTSIDDRIQYRFMNANVGYGAGHNIVLQNDSLRADYNLVLNPDMIFNPMILVGLTDYMDSNNNTGLCIPGILYPDGSFQNVAKLLPTPSNLILRRFQFLKTLTERSNAVYELKGVQRTREIQAPFLSGCFMFIRSSILRTVGYFDERYFMYLEDVDLSRRIYKSSNCVYLPEFRAFHEHQKQSYKSNRLLKIHISSAIKYFVKWGWLFDKERAQINAEVRKKYGLS